MPSQLASTLRNAIATERTHLQAMSETDASVKPGGRDSWSPKQELGHLIDSAANNHIRFVRAALEPSFVGPSYAQNDWVAVHGYQDKPWAATVAFWHSYNTFLAELIERIPDEKLSTICSIGSSEPATLGFVIEDYVLHLQHHIDHLLRRAAVTQYPSAVPAAR